MGRAQREDSGATYNLIAHSDPESMPFATRLHSIRCLATFEWKSIGVSYRRIGSLARYIDIKLERRGVACVALLLDERAPTTCDLVWNNLPASGGLWHAKYASHEVYCLVPQMDGPAPGIENSTIVPTKGDVAYFALSAAELAPGQLEEAGLAEARAVVNLAVFYERNNLLLSPVLGLVPAKIFATVVENLDGFAKACYDVFRHGAAGETLTYSRAAMSQR